MYVLPSINPSSAILQPVSVSKERKSSYSGYTDFGYLQILKIKQKSSVKTQANVNFKMQSHTNQFANVRLRSYYEIHLSDKIFFNGISYQQLTLIALLEQ